MQNGWNEGLTDPYPANGVPLGFVATVATNSSPEAAGPRSPTLYVHFTGQGNLDWNNPYNTNTDGTLTLNHYEGTCVLGGSVAVGSPTCASLGISINSAAGTISFSNTPLYRNNVLVNRVTGTLVGSPF
jgi:hypothetical protein